ncbi:hypothetical protein [Proteiniclasticum ruminis]|uniref:hypothetical protein n=1 Tax=Proteiniclasticum ruminis TaxID=398199 RepID=UPI00094436E2|nr:hypothetical protein [Proteiniclasticum ruminis]
MPILPKTHFLQEPQKWRSDKHHESTEETKARESKTFKEIGMSETTKQNKKGEAARQNIYEQVVKVQKLHQSEL